MTSKKHMGQRIRHYRLKKKLSLEELAGRVGADFSHIGKVERGERGISIDLLQKIAKTLHVDPADLLK